jgi:hypothetical protein
VRGIGRTLDFAIEEAKAWQRALYLLFIREQPVMAPGDRRRKWTDDEEARAIFAYASEKAKGLMILPCYAVSDAPADTIVDIAATVGASHLIVGARLMILPCYAVSDAPADTIVDIAATVGASHLIVGAPQRSMIVNLLRGNIIRNISELLPEEIHLLMYA